MMMHPPLIILAHSHKCQHHAMRLGTAFPSLLAMAKWIILHTS